MTSPNSDERYSRREALQGLFTVGLSLFSITRTAIAEPPREASAKKGLAAINFTRLSSDRRLILCGGGSRPLDAIERFVGFARESSQLRAAKQEPGRQNGPLREISMHAERSEILVVGWAMEDSERFLPAFRDQIAHYRDCILKTAPSRAEMLEKRSRKGAESFMNSLATADGIFFLGGDQADLMKVLDANENVRDAVKSFYDSGRVVGGTSAGTAIMSDPMINGYSTDDALKVAAASIKELRGASITRGLGFCPQGIIVDQHGWSKDKPGRVERGRAVTRALGKPVALVIGEDAALSLITRASGDVSLKVLGGEVAMSTRTKKDGTYVDAVLDRGSTLTLEPSLLSEH